MAQAIEEKRVRPEYKDADLLAQMAWAPVHGVLALHVAKKMEPEWIEARPPRETAQALIDAFIRGITKEA